MIAIVKIRGGIAYIDCPFNPGFVADFKRLIPYKYRSWDPQRKLWAVDESYWPDTEDILRQYFADVRVFYPKSERPENQPRAEPSGPYSTLQLLDTAPNELVVAAYRVLAKIHHPDHGGNVEAMKKINLAYEKIRQERKIA